MSLRSPSPAALFAATENLYRLPPSRPVTTSDSRFVLVVALSAAVVSYTSVVRAPSSLPSFRIERSQWSAVAAYNNKSREDSNPVLLHEVEVIAGDSG